VSRTKIKSETRPKKKRVRGYRQHRNLQNWERNRTQANMREQVRRRRLTKVDEITGETYVLSRLVLKDKAGVGEYKDGLDAALLEAPRSAEVQAEAIRCYLQGCIDDGRLVAIPCGRGESPTCRVYQGENKRVVAIRQDDPDLN